MTNFNNISEADTTAANNSSINSISILGTGLVSTADDSFRSYASQLAKWWNDLGAVNTVGGTANAITLTTSTTYVAYKTGMLIRFVAGSSNTGAVTFNLDGIGAKAGRRIVSGTDVALVQGDIIAGRTYVLRYSAAANSAAGGFIVTDAGTLFSTFRQRTNRFWNHACEVSQQNGTTLGTTNGYFACDSLAMYFTASTAAMSVQQIAGPTLNGSTHQIEYKCTTAKTVLGTSDYVALTAKIEGLDVADLQWGTASAIPATYSFQFKGPQVLYHVHLQNRSGNRHIAIPFTPTAANTEERITVVVPGDTSGTWTVDNDTLLTADVILAAGSGLTGGSASTWSASTFYAATTQGNILSANTNVVRVGDFTFSPDPDATSVAPAWVPVDIGNATRDCQRYFQFVTSGIGKATSATTATLQATYPLMRTTPIIAYLAGTNGLLEVDVSVRSFTGLATGASGPSSAFISVTGSSGLTAPNMVAFEPGNFIVINARLS